jgi:ribulose-phosphate 3-epimerase
MGARLSVSASIVAAQLLDLREELERLRSAGVDGVHVDIEDGHFVPVMGLGTRLAEAAGEWGGLPVDTHLMVSDPERDIALLGSARLDAIAVHAESTPYPRRVLGMIRDTGRRAGLALNPATPPPDLDPIADHLDYLLMLTTEPEARDPAFLRGRLAAVARMSETGIPVIVDGGVGPAQVDAILAAGATGVVAGRALFASEDLAATVRALHGDAA